MQIVKLGNLGMQVKGEWNKDAVYKRLDIVRYNNASYLAMHKLTLIGEAPDKSTAWMCLAKDGEKIPDNLIKQVEGKLDKADYEKDKKDNEWARIKAAAIVEYSGVILSSFNVTSVTAGADGGYFIYSPAIKSTSIVLALGVYHTTSYLPVEWHPSRVSNTYVHIKMMGPGGSQASGRFQIIII